MVRKLKAATVSFQIGELWIVGHGGRAGQFIGEDALTLKTVENFRPTLERLTPLFAKDAVVTLCGCEMGRNLKLQLALLDVW